MLPDAVIFDIDGTLWDASKTSADGWNTGLKMLGIEQSKIAHVSPAHAEKTTTTGTHVKQRIIISLIS